MNTGSIELDGFQIVYTQAGSPSNPPVLFLHGIMSHRGVWTRTMTSRGKPVEKREADPSLLAFEKTTQLVTSGIYKYIRHPLYSSLLVLTWGIFFKHLSAIGVALAITATIFLVFTSEADEVECIQFFGAEYQDYMKHTKRFIPFLF